MCPKPQAQWVLMTPAPAERSAYIEHSIRLWKTLNGPGFPFDEDRTKEKAVRSFERGPNPAGTARQLVAILASGSRKQGLNALTLPALVIHGDADPLIPVEYGIQTANSIPGAELIIIPGMGHNLPEAVWPQVIGAIVRHARRGEAPQE